MGGADDTGRTGHRRTQCWFRQPTRARRIRRTHPDFTDKPVEQTTPATIFGPLDYIDSGKSARYRRISPRAAPARNSTPTSATAASAAPNAACTTTTDANTAWN